MWSAVLWIALAIVGIIIGSYIGSEITDDDISFPGAFIGFLLVAFLKFTFTDKEFKFERIIFNENHPSNISQRNYIEHGMKGSKMILETDGDVAKCTLIDNELLGGEKTTFIFIKYDNSDSFADYYHNDDYNLHLTLNKSYLIFYTTAILRSDFGTIEYDRKYL